jgi:hypothetical protein
MHSTANFIRDLLLIGKARARGKQIAIIANRTRIRTRSMIKLERFLRNLDIPVIAQIRDTQNYVHAVEQGIGVNELADSAAQRDSAPWAHILDWIQQYDGENDSFAAPLSPAMPPLPERQHAGVDQLPLAGCLTLKLSGSRDRL